MNTNLNYEGFENNLVDEGLRWTGNYQYVFKFDNGYGASVVKGDDTYGSEKDLWEVAVLWFGDYDQYELNYDTGITDDVIGYLTDEDVKNLLERIRNLDENGKEN